MNKKLLTSLEKSFTIGSNKFQDVSLRYREEAEKGIGMLLSSGRLTVDISDDTSRSGCRFDRTLSIRQVTLDGRHTFLGHERTKDGIGTGGFGLQFGFLWDSDPPVSRQPGGEGKCRHVYPLLGVGNLSIPKGERYSVFGSYGVEPAKITCCERSDSHIQFRCLQPGLAIITRTLSLSGTDLCVQTTCRNLSSIRFSAEEYCHNFLRFDSKPISGAQETVFAAPPFLSPVKGEFLIDGDILHVGRFSDDTGTVSAHILGTADCSPHVVRVQDTGIGSSVTLTDEFLPHKVYCWASPWAICPEVFFLLELGPGEQVSWTRRISVADGPSPCDG